MSLSLPLLKNNIKIYIDDYGVYTVTSSKELDYYKNIDSSSLGSVIGYPSVTVPMGFIKEFSYGIEFLSRAYEEEKIYNVALSFEKINGNDVKSSSLVPSLYDIPNDVIKLIELYEKTLISNSSNKIVKEWLGNVHEFWINYNDYEDCGSIANDLIKMYKVDMISYKSSSSYKSLSFIISAFTLLMIGLSILIIYSEIRRCFN